LGEDNVEKRADSSTRAAVWAMAGIVVLLALAGFFAIAVAPFLQARSVLRQYACDEMIGGIHIAGDSPRNEAIRRLGGAGAAVRRLRAYLCWPGWAAPDRSWALILLLDCGPPGRVVLGEVILNEGKPEALRLEALDLLTNTGHSSWEPYEKLPDREELVRIVEESVGR